MIPKAVISSWRRTAKRVVNAPFTIAGATYFGTNRPTPANANSCSADLGEAYAYKSSLFCRVPAAPSKLAGGGLPPLPVGGIVTIDINGVPTQIPFLIGGTGPSAFDIDQPKPPIPPVRTRQNWRIDTRTGDAPRGSAGGPVVGLARPAAFSPLDPASQPGAAALAALDANPLRRW
jgi:hypothetical protein